MFINFEKVSIFVKPGITDMRKQINGLSVLVEEENDKNCHLAFVAILDRKMGFLPHSTEYCQSIDRIYSTFSYADMIYV